MPRRGTERPREDRTGQDRTGQNRSGQGWAENGFIIHGTCLFQYRAPKYRFNPSKQFSAFVLNFDPLIFIVIIYIDEKQQIVSFQKHAKPFDETSLPSEAPAKYVLEINAGLSDEWQLKIGDRIHFTKD